MATRLIKYLFRSIFFLIVVTYFSVAGFLIVTKYWFMPQIDSWRPHIEASLSQAVGARVRLEQIEAGWSGFSPTFEIAGLTVFDAQGREALVVPKINAELSWRSVLAREPLFRYIGIEGLALAVQRSEAGVIQVAGFLIEPDKLGQTTGQEQATQAAWHQTGVARWLLAQGRVDLNQAIVVWIDQQRGALPLKIENLSLSLRNRLLSHHLSGRFELSSSPNQRVEFALRSDKLGRVLIALGDDKVDGEAYLSLSDIDPQSLSPWLDLPSVSGRYAARAWLGLRQGKLANSAVELVAVNAGTGVAGPEETSWHAERLSFRLDGPLGVFLPPDQHADYVSHVGVTNPVAFRLDASAMVIDPPADVMSPLRLEQLQVRTNVRLNEPGDLNVSLDSVNVKTQDGEMSVRGRWNRSRDSEMGDMDLQGTLTQFDLSRLYHYMPAEVGEDVIDWMRTAFRSGTVPRASFVAHGPVSEFPFEGTSKGVFTLEGTVQNWTVDYAPALTPEEKGWPALVAMNGRFNLNRDNLVALMQSGGLEVSKGVNLEANRIEATLTHLFSEPALELKARTRGTADLYQKAMTQTALDGVLPPMVRQLNGRGDWSLDLELAMLLDDVENPAYKATLDLHGGSLQYAQLPPIEAVSGQAVFTNAGFTSDGLSARVLGSDLTVSGGFGAPDAKLLVQGGLAMQAVNDHFKVPSLNRWVKGTLPFVMTVVQPDAKGSLKIAVDSSLQGLQLLFPAPFTLATGAALKTRLEWEMNPASNSVGSGTLRMGNLLQVNATGRQGSGTRFASVGIGIGVAPPLVSNAMAIRVSTKLLDATAWQAVQTSLMKDFSVSSSPGLLPALASVQLSSDRVMWDDTGFDKVQATMRVTGERYVADFSAQQANGSLNWQMRNGELIGRLQARLSRFEVGQEPAGDGPAANPPDPKANKIESSLPDENTLSTIPPIDLVIDNLMLNGKRLGQLELVGESTVGNRQWKIDKLTLSGPNASLSSSGHLRFERANPGVNADIQLDIKDMGEFVAQLGLADKMRRGRGTIKAQVDWRNFPWSTSFEGMQGKVQVDLEEGIFDHVNSGSARVLELLSLQSFGRILDLNVNRGETFAKGFPWSSIRGNLGILNGQLETSDLVIDSPVARITFQGEASLVTEQLNMRATVRPNLDMSGTAMATGFLLNPVIGLSALVGNYILRTPIESVFSLRYEVTGSFSDPQLKEAGATEEPLPESVRKLKEQTSSQDRAKANPSQGPAAPGSSNPGAGISSGAAPLVVPEREVFRIELGKDSGFDPSPRKDNVQSPPPQMPVVPSSP